MNSFFLIVTNVRMTKMYTSIKYVFLKKILNSSEITCLKEVFSVCIKKRTTGKLARASLQCYIRNNSSKNNDFHNKHRLDLIFRRILQFNCKKKNLIFIEKQKIYSFIKKLLAQSLWD